MTRPLTDRFWDCFQKSSGCWLRSGTTGDDGFIITLLGGGQSRDLRVHQRSWMGHHGTIPTGTEVYCCCDTPTCVNPAPLFPGMHLEHARDGMAKCSISYIPVGLPGPIRRRHAARQWEWDHLSPLVIMEWSTYPSEANPSTSGRETRAALRER